MTDFARTYVSRCDNVSFEAVIAAWVQSTSPTGRSSAFLVWYFVAAGLLLACGGRTASEFAQSWSSSGGTSMGNDAGGGTFRQTAGGTHSLGSLSNVGGTALGNYGGSYSSSIAGGAGQTSSVGSSSGTLVQDSGSPISGNYTPSGYPRCGSLDPARANDCDGIDKIQLLSPDVSSMVDGSIEVGESSGVSVWVRNNDTVDHDNICIGVLVDVPGIQLSDPNPAPEFGIVPPGTTFISQPVTKYVKEAIPGTTAHFTFWPTFDGTNCVGVPVTVDAPVKQYPY